MSDITLRLVPGKTIKLEDGHKLAQQIDRWAKGLIRLDGVLKFLDKISLDRQHLAEGVIQRGRLVDVFRDLEANPDFPCPFQTAKGATSIRLLTLLLESPRARMGAVSAVWAMSPKDDDQWIGKLVGRLGAHANFELLINYPQSSGKKRSRVNMMHLVLEAIPAEQRAMILALGKKRRKISELYKVTGWEECRQLAPDSKRADMLATDMGL